MNPSTFDYIIVGAGSAGSLLANRLSADARHRVLLIEAGRKDDYHWVHVPAGYLKCMGNPRTDWCYETTPNPMLGGRRLPYPRGKVLGGSSSINGMIYMRGQSHDYDQWAAITGCDSWRWDNALPYFQLHEDHHRGANSHHGAKGTPAALLAAQAPKGSYWHTLRGRQAGGEWRVDAQRLHWPVLDAFAQAAEQAGIAPTDDFNRGNNEGVGYFEVNQKDGWRWNAAKAFLRPTCYGRPNMEMWTQAQVSKLLLTPDADGGQRCTGVQVWSGLEMVEAHATREVIVCAGSIGSVQLLELSGIGDGAMLQAHGVACAVDLPGVGANLQDHLQLRSIYRVSNTRTLNTQSASWWGKAAIGLEYLFKRTGPLSMAPSQLGIFTKSDASQAWPNIQYHIQPLSLDAFGSPLHRFDAITASVCNLKPTSRGTVHIQGPDFKQAPAISPNYLSTAQDQQVAADSLRVTRRIVQQSALAPFAPQEIAPGAEHQSDAALVEMAGQIGTTIFHPVGTTRMGADGDAMAVVNARLQVRGVRGLRVVDAGVMPLITSGNTNSPVLMIAEKAAQWIAEDAVHTA